MLSRSWRQQPPSLLSLGGGVWFDLTCFAQSELSVAVVVTRKLYTFNFSSTCTTENARQISEKREVFNVPPFLLTRFELRRIHVY